MQKRPDVSVKVIIRAGSKILMFHRSDGTYDFPGGRLEWGESPEEGAKRELIEELNYELPRALAFLDIYNYISKDGTRHSVFLHYFLELDHMPQLHATAEEADAEVIWLAIGDMRTVIPNPAFVEAIYTHQ